MHKRTREGASIINDIQCRYIDWLICSVSADCMIFLSSFLRMLKNCEAKEGGKFFYLLHKFSSIFYTVCLFRWIFRGIIAERFAQSLFCFEEYTRIIWNVELCSRKWRIHRRVTCPDGQSCPTSRRRLSSALQLEKIVISLVSVNSTLQINRQIYPLCGGVSRWQSPQNFLTVPVTVHRTQSQPPHLPAVLIFT